MTVRTAGPATIRPKVAPPSQEIRFCRGKDGVRLAYAVHGSGPPLVVVSCWLSHLQHDWRSPVWRHFLEDLGAFATVVRYDERGFGMSDWAVEDFSIEARLGDLEAIVDSLGLSRFALLGMSGGGPVAMAYAARHPERVTRMVLYGSSSGCLQERSTEEQAEEDTYLAMIRVGWAKPEPIFRRVFTTQFIPGAAEVQLRWFDDLQRMATSPENAATSRIARRSVDIADLLPRISVPTLVLHATGDQAVPISAGALIASLVPGAHLVALDSRNHILLADEPAWSFFVAEVTAFLEPDRRALQSDRGQHRTEQLSPRELDVLRLAADGRTNDEIAATLSLSVRTVERHLSNIYAKLDLTGKAGRAGAVAEYLRHLVV